MDKEEQLKRLMKASRELCIACHLYGLASGTVAVAINELAKVHDAIIDEQEAARKEGG